MTKLFWILLFFLVGQLTLLSIGFFQDAAYKPVAGVHPVDPFKDKTLQKELNISINSPTLLVHTGDQEDRSNSLSLGYLFSLFLVGIMGSLVFIGVRKKGKVGPYGPWLLGAFIILGLIFTALAVSYNTYLTGDTSGTFGGYPYPTAWMIYGVWLFPLLLVGLFISTFDKWFLSKEDLDSFREWVKENQLKGGEEA